MFECEGVDREAATSDPAGDESVKKGLFENLQRFADAAAAFRVCAVDKRVPDEQSLEWTGRAMDLATITEDLSKHFHHDELFVAYWAAQAKSTDDPEFQRAVLKQTNDCTVGLQEAAKYVSDAQKIAEYFSKLPDTALDSPNEAASAGR
jgi:hypothetical protein